MSRAVYAATLESLAASKVPAHLHPGLARYMAYGVEPGAFLCAVLENDLGAAWARGSSWEATGEVVAWLARYSPADCWGSKTAVRDWAVRRQAEAAASPSAAHGGAL